MSKHETSEKALEASKRNIDILVQDYMNYLDSARTPTKAVRAAASMLEKKGFVKYNPGMKSGCAEQIYFMDRNNVNIAAVAFGQKPVSMGLNIAGAHVDFCTLTNKVVSAIEKSDGVYLDTRPYGGFYAHQWMDRPLVVIGETLVKVKKAERQLAEWQIQGNIPEPTIHNPRGYKDGAKSYNDMFPLENLDVFTGYKDIKSFLKAVNKASSRQDLRIAKEDFNSGFNLFHVVPSEKTLKLGNYIIGYGHDDRACMFSALQAVTSVKNPEYTSIALGVAREEIGSSSVGSANDIFLEQVIRALSGMSGFSQDLQYIYERSVMLSADVDIAYTPQNEHVSDKNNCAQFGKGAALVIANGSSGNPTGNIIMPNDLAYIERFLDKRNLAYQVTALPSRVGIGGGGGTIAEYYSQRGILTADLGVPVGNMHGTTSRIYAADLDSTVECFKALFERQEERKNWG
ncbi:MAG: hypothetical protein PHO02_03620 [Candidatus Nanoarchaeia archaeon]|nr:hypothetical protein [Candidatus Nanoarchaeia archaeon]